MRQKKQSPLTRTGLPRIRNPDIALIKADLTSFRDEMRQTIGAKTWVLSAMLAQTFVILGGVAGLLKLPAFRGTFKRDPSCVAPVLGQVPLDLPIRETISRYDGNFAPTARLRRRNRA